MNNKPLVSVITPCYNGECHVGRLISSILNQTYENIEFIIVNDGSTDDSEKIILSYKEEFEKKGYIFKYIKQNNKGLGGAINKGLKFFTGEFLCWPDSDDYLEKDSIEQRIKVLLDNPEYAVVTSNAYIRKSDNLEEYRLLVNKENRKYVETPDAFYSLLMGKGVFCSGCHMIRVSMFLDVNPNREIYEAKRGQNWQMLLPVFFKYKRFFLDIPLYNYIDYPESMSKNQNNLESLFCRLCEHENIIISTLFMIEKYQCIKLDSLRDDVKSDYLRKKLELALEFGDRKLYKKLFQQKRYYTVSIKENILFVLAQNSISFKIYRLVRNCFRKLYSIVHTQ